MNQRPLGYERPCARVSNRLYGTYGYTEVRKSALRTPVWESVGSEFCDCEFCQNCPQDGDGDLLSPSAYLRYLCSPQRMTHPVNRQVRIDLLFRRLSLFARDRPTALLVWGSSLMAGTRTSGSHAQFRILVLPRQRDGSILDDDLAMAPETPF